ncbi:MAG: NAD-dependent epimerase/dehydratase family protein [Alphaproteobacteria bacterium]|nr:MAG: NAD-dependent epimerase/dehydratase family protein [Alphaproteobacteria bacterium]
MKILIVGHRGYVGPVLAEHLASNLPGAEIHGRDVGWFEGAEAAPFPEDAFASQHVWDARDVTPADLAGLDAVVQLAAVSNDPIGREFEAATAAINTGAALAVARAAKAAGVGRFVFASSCSMYGAGGQGLRAESDPLDPLTAYARSKVATEEGLRELAGDGFQVTSLRFATACGASPMLRLDLVLNDFVATALRTGRIEVLSDGSPWRPLIHVGDMARAVEWALIRDGAPRVEVNVGSQGWTWQIGQLAQDVAAVLGGVDVEINRDAAPDTRSYRVDFSLFRQLAPDHQPAADFADAVRGLADQIAAMDFAGAVRESRFIRLNMLRGHVAEGRLDGDLRWSRQPVHASRQDIGHED